MLSVVMAASRQLLIGCMSYVRKELESVFAKVEAADLEWAPQPGMRSIGGQVAEIVATEGQFNEVFTGRPFDFGGRYEEVKAMAELVDLKAAFTDARTLTLHRIEAASDEFLAEPVPIDPAWFESGGLELLPRIEILQALPMHEWYHTAQLVSYMWIKGFNPYDSEP